MGHTTIVVTPAPAGVEGPALPATTAGICEEVATHAIAYWMADGLDWATVEHAPTSVCLTQIVPDGADDTLAPACSNRFLADFAINSVDFKQTSATISFLWSHGIRIKRSDRNSKNPTTNRTIP
jgi:hypothetical protein